MNNAKDLSRAERCEIAILLQKGYSARAIGKALGRGKSTISYEIKMNSTLGTYDPQKADQKARLRKRMRKLQFSKIEGEPSLKSFIIEKLKAHWNPDEISGYIKRNQKQYPWYVSKTAIYQWLRTSQGERYCAFLYSKRKCVKKRKKKAVRVLIPNRVAIYERPRGSTRRSRYGHWEKDAIVSRKGISTSLAVANERKSRLVRARKVKNMSPVDHEYATEKMLEDTKALSITRDNGIENIYHERNPVPSFFCESYSSWQKGSVENANKIIRSFFPKGTNFRLVTQREINIAVRLINEKPRKILGYRSALEVAKKAGIIKNIKSGVS